MRFVDLLARPDVHEQVRLRSRFGILAFHGGLEAGTEAIAVAAATRAGASVYVVTQPAELRWHVPSHQITASASAMLACFLTHVEVAVAIHGYGRRGRHADVLLGGRNRALAAQLAGALASTLPSFEAVTDLARIPPELRGMHGDNPVNRPPRGGVQVELPPPARGEGGVVDGLVAIAAGWA